VKIGAEADLAGVSYDFGQSTVMKACVTALGSFAHNFRKGFARPPGIESVLDPQEKEPIVFEDFLAPGLRIPPHPFLLDIPCKFQVQLHQLTPNAIVQIGKFVWAVTSCGGHPTVDIFAHHYEPHYQNKKIHLEGSKTTFAVQFGCITFHLSRLGNHTRLTTATRNKWPSGWDDNWFYHRVPLEQTTDFRGKRTYPLRSKMAELNYLMKVPSSCGPEDTNLRLLLKRLVSSGVTMW
jgi:hypothetical protein